MDAVLPPDALQALEQDLRALCTEHVTRAAQRQLALLHDTRVTAQDVVYIQLKVLREAARMLEQVQGQVCNQGAALGLSNTAMGEPLGIGREGVRGLRQRTAQRSAQ